MVCALCQVAKVNNKIEKTKQKKMLFLLEELLQHMSALFTMSEW